MAVLLLQLAGPMQAWGTQSRFSVRETGLEPSKSGVVGLLACALGRTRDKSVEDLASMSMAVRVDREGTMQRDFQVAQDVARANQKSHAATVISNRYYLADAWFLVGLEHDDVALLKTLHDAVNNPRWPLSLGRKAFPPTVPVWLPDGLRSEEDLSEAIRAYPWAKPRNYLPGSLRIAGETSDPGTGTLRMDQPLAFSFHSREFAPRFVTTEWLDTAELPVREDAV